METLTSASFANTAASMRRRSPSPLPAPASKIPVRSPSTTPNNSSPKHLPRDTRSSSPGTPRQLSPAPGSRIPVQCSPGHKRRTVSPPPRKKQVNAKQRAFQSSPSAESSKVSNTHQQPQSGQGDHSHTFEHLESSQALRSADVLQHEDETVAISKGESTESIPAISQDDNASVSSASTLSFSISSISVPSKVSLSSDGSHLNPLLPHQQTMRRTNTLEEDSHISDDDTHLRLRRAAQSSALLEIKIKQLENEKDSLQLELCDIKQTTNILTEENRLLKEAQVRSAAQTSSLKLQVEELEQREDSLIRSQALEVSQLKQELIDDSKEEKEKLLELLNQIKNEKNELQDKLQGLQTEHSFCQNRMDVSINSQSDQLVAVTSDLLSAKNKIKRMQESLQKCEREKEISERSLELEKTNAREVQEILTPLRQTLEKSTVQMESLHSELLGKTSVLQEKEKQVELLEMELESSKEDYKRAIASYQAMKLEIDVVQQSLLSKTVQLEEELRKRNTTETENVELSLKMSDIKRELKEKESLLEGSHRLGAHLSSELESLRSGSKSLKETLVEKEAMLQAQVQELAEVQHEKEMMARKLLEMEAQLQMATDTNEVTVNEITSRIYELQTQNKTLQQQLSDAEQQKKALQLMQQATSSSAELEKEKNTSMRCELITLKDSLHALQDESSILEKELAKANTLNNKHVESEAQLQAEKEEGERVRQELVEQLSSADLNLRQKERDLEVVQSKCTDLESQVTHATTNSNKFRELSMSLEAKLDMLQTTKLQQILILQEELEEKERAISEFNQQVYDFCHQLDAGDGKGGLPEVLARIKLRERETSERMRVEKEELLGSIAQVKNELASCKVELAGANASLMQAQQECIQLRASVSSETAIHTKTAATLSELQLEHSKVVDRLKEVEIQLKEKEEDTERMRLHLEETQDHCSTLQEELRLQSEVSTASAKSMEMKTKEKIRHLQAKMDKITHKLSQAEGAIKELRRDVVTSRDESNTLESQLTETNTYLKEVTSKLEEERTTRAECQRKIRELETALKQEKDINERHIEQLTDKKMRLQLAESQQSKKGEELSALTNSNAAVKLLLEEEKARTMSLKEQITTLQGEQAMLMDNLERMREDGANSAKKAEEEISSIKKKQRSETESLKENIQQLHSDIKSLRSISVARGEEISRLEKKELLLQGEKTKLMKKLAEKDRELKDKKEALTTTEIRVQSLEAQLSNMHVEVLALSRSQKEIERFKKKLEISSKEEVQQVLEKVTDQLEHQYTAHQELEKLRLKQEAMLLREKERQISQLRNELYHKKLEHKKDKLQIETLELETKYLRSKSQDEERSRKRFEARVVGRLADESRSVSAPLSSSTPRSLKYQ